MTADETTPAPLPARATSGRTRPARRKGGRRALVVRIVLLPLRTTLAAARLGAVGGYRAGRLSVVAGRGVGRTAGWGIVAAFLAGLGAGLVLSGSPGRRIRASLRRALRGGPGAGELATSVRFELSHAPRTWHLEQPEVAVDDDVVTLRGTVADESAREAMERVARSVPGVRDVVNDLLVG